MAKGDGHFDYAQDTTQPAYGVGVVPRVGFEPTRPYAGPRGLSPLRLPFRHLGTQF